MEKNAKLRLYKTPRALVKTDALVLKAMGSHYWVFPGHRHVGVGWRDIRLEHEWSPLDYMELLCS